MISLNQQTGNNDSTNGNCNGKHKLKYRDKFPSNETLLTSTAFNFRARNAMPPINLNSHQPLTMSSRVVGLSWIQLSLSRSKRRRSDTRIVWAAAAQWNDRRAQTMRPYTQHQCLKDSNDHWRKSFRRLVCCLNLWKLPGSLWKLIDKYLKPNRTEDSIYCRFVI
jgi:hypothetical protein